MSQRVLGGGPLVDESTARQTVVSSGGRTFLLDEQASGPTTHTATGVLAGAGATTTGAARRFRAHSASGALAGAGGTAAGAASRFRSHAATGALTGAGSVLSGSATRTPSAQRFVPGHTREAPHYPRFRSAEEIRRHRDELLGITPAVEKVVEKAAKRVVAKAARQDTTTQPDPLEWLEANYKQQQAALAADLKRLKIKASEEERRNFMILLGLEIEASVSRKRQIEAETEARNQEDEEAQVLLLLFEM